MVKDPQFLADAATRRLGVDPMTGEELQKIVLDVTSQPQEVIDTMNAAIMPPKQ